MPEMPVAGTIGLFDTRPPTVEMPATMDSQIAVCLNLARAISRTRTVHEIYDIALDALATGLGVSRSSILLFDPDGVMRFNAHRGISEAYRKAVEGHTPWRPDSSNAEPIVVPDVTKDASLAPYLPAILAEGIAAMAFIPLTSLGGVIGKFMLYYESPHAFTADELQLSGIIASEIAFAVERTRTEEQARRSEERLRFALDAALMGTWDWELATNTLRWSDNLERIHGLSPGTFDGTFSSYEREIHPDDRERVLASIKRALALGVPHDVEYRIVAPDGSVRWVEGKGHVEYREGQPIRMTGVCMIVTRRKEAELARLAAAEEASRLKDDFLATLSHELRTPLNAILGWVQMLQAEGLSTGRTRQAVDIIGRNARLQAQLIEDILDVSRIITGKLEIERVPVMVPQLVDTVVNGLLPVAEGKKIRLTKVAADVPPIEGDPKRLHQVLANVVSNAIKFTPEGGRVEIGCSAKGDAIEIEVRDSGVGIEPEFLPYIFDRFRQADSRSTRKHGGLGLGLAIARHLLEQHQGEILAHSDGVGHGTTVTIRLPAGSGVAVKTAISQPSVSDSNVELRMDGSTVLVVDDQQDSRELLAALFERCGAHVVQCDSANAALEAMKNSQTHLIVADIAMPEIDGYELIRRVRSLHVGIPAIAVSAYARSEDRNKALASGYNEYCAKPIEGLKFLQTIRQIMTVS
jgi:PAS domain S-box-containing protein